MTERLSRRGFLVASAAAAGLVARPLLAQEPQSQGAANVPMDQGAYQSVRRPPKPGATPQLTAQQRDDLEHRIRCQCGCTLDVYTCRTTDFSCSVSPAMHADVLALVEGGHSADEIVAAFMESYGERVLMAPTKRGFNLLGYFMPFVALAGGATAAALLIRRWRRDAVARAEATAKRDVAVPAVQASDDELARLAAAVRDDR